MSRGQKPRTPLYFPKMKVRGRRNRRKSSLRISHFYTMRANVQHVGGDHVDFVASEQGSHLIEYKTPTYDGWGRVVADALPPKPKAPPKPKPVEPVVHPTFGNIGFLTDSGELIPIASGATWNGLTFEPEDDEEQETWTMPSGTFEMEVTGVSPELHKLITGL